MRSLSIGMLAGLLAVSSAQAGLPGAVEIDGKDLPLLVGEARKSLRVYAFHDGLPVAIPYQIDPREKRDRWVLEHGRAQRKDDEPGVLDENDALVFMNADLGAQGDVRLLPSEARRWIQLRVGDAADPLGFAYVGSFAEPPARSGVDYARYDPENDRILTDVYEATFGAPLPTSLRLDGREENVLRGVRAKGEARFFGGLFTLRRSEKDIEAEIEGWIDGPVRVVRPARYRISLPLGFRATARVNLIFYRDHVVGHAVARIKIPPRLVPADGELTAFFEFRDQGDARLFVPEASGYGRGRETRWAGLLLGEGRTFLVAVRPEGSLKNLEQRLYFDESTAMPAFGFELGRVNRLQTGEHDLYVSVMLLDSHDPEAVTRAADLLRDPPEVHVAEVVPAMQRGKTDTEPDV